MRYVLLLLALGLVLAACGTDTPPTPTAIVPTQTPWIIVVTATPLPASPTPAVPPTATLVAAPISIQILSKTLHKADYSISGDKDAITFRLAITNQAGHNLRAFNGVLHFQDLFSKDIKAVNWTYSTPLAAGATANWDGQINYNPYVDADVTLGQAKLEDLHVQLVVQNMIYLDGTQVPVNP
jgi:hypothetical protein